MKQTKGRILLVSRNVPPEVSSHGLRVFHFIKYLTEFGWKLDVLTVSPPPNFPFADQSSIEKIPDSVTIYRTHPGIFSKIYYDESAVPSENISNNDKKNQILKNMLMKLSKTLEFVLINVMNASMLFDWYPFAVMKGFKLVKKYNYDVIISSGGHLVSHLITYTINKSEKIHWVADYGDPWVFNPTYRDKYSKIKFLMDHWLEQCILKSADVITVTTEETKKNYLDKYPFLRKEKVKVIPMGTDYNVFKSIHAEGSEKFRMLYMGTLFPTQDIKPFLDAVKLLYETGETKEDIEVLFVGNIEDKYKELVTNMGLEDKVSFGSFVPYETSLSLIMGADVLLSFGNRGGLQVPGKLFDYVAGRRPILWIKGDEKDPALRYLEGLNRAITVDNKNEDIYPKILMLYNLYKRQELEKNFDLKELPAFSWNDRVKVLNAICEGLMRDSANK